MLIAQTHQNVAENTCDPPLATIDDVAVTLLSDGRLNVGGV